MEVILLKDVEHVGQENDLVKVKAGFGRNYLIPHGFAMLANKSALKVREERLRVVEAKHAKLMAALDDVVKKLQGGAVKVGAKVGQTDKIFGSITNVQLAEAIKKQLGIEIDRKKITIEEDVKSIGEYTAKVSLHSELAIDVKFEVVGE